MRERREFVCAGGAERSGLGIVGRGQRFGPLGTATSPWERGGPEGLRGLAPGVERGVREEFIGHWECMKREC